MTKRNKIVKRLVALNTIITMTLYYFLIIGVTTVSYAAGIGQDNVEFSSYFKDEQGNKLTSINVTKTEEVYLYFSVNVLKEGYFNGKITLNNSNFDISDEIIDDKISSIEANTITLSQVNNGDTAEFKLKLNIKAADEYDLNLLSKETETVLKGTYVNSKTEKDVEESTTVRLTLISPYDVQTEDTLGLSVLTNKVYEIDGESKRLVQVLVTNSLEGNNYPVQETTLNLSAPEETEEVYVYSRGTLLTNGESDNEFSESSFSYNKETNNIQINLKNEVVVNESGEAIVTWNKTGSDKLIVTYILPEDTILPEEIEANCTMSLYDGYIENQTASVFSSTKSVEIEEEKESLVTGAIASRETSIYKGKIYSGEERELSVVTKVEIDFAGIEDKITVGRNKRILPTNTN